MLVAGKHNVNIKLLHKGRKFFSAFLYLLVYKIIVGAKEIIMGNNYLPANVGVGGNSLLHKFLVLIPLQAAGVNMHKQHVIVCVPIVTARGAVSIAFAVNFGIGVVEIIFIKIGIVIVVTD